MYFAVFWRKTSAVSRFDIDSMCFLWFFGENKLCGRNFCGNNAYLATFGEKTGWMSELLLQRCVSDGSTKQTSGVTVWCCRSVDCWEV